MGRSKKEEAPPSPTGVENFPGDEEKKEEVGEGEEAGAAVEEEKTEEAATSANLDAGEAVVEGEEAENVEGKDENDENRTVRPVDQDAAERFEEATAGFSHNPLIRYVQVQRHQALERVVHYGPPYHAEYGGNIVEECNDAKPSLMDIHGYLNEGADPRSADANDYNNCPMHYAARYANLTLAKMLHRAGCEIDVMNELGVTPLSTACMFNQVRLLK